MQPKFLITLPAIVSLAHTALVATPSHPNILFIFYDDHAAHAISTCGSKISHPDLDLITMNGMNGMNGKQVAPN